ncbi:hypothetical protein CU098_007171 [Rhizopus stolonifer]|uniref:Uncharacterized protein n=1 Tax=Rhizopus stolonifer TaxID=4846 RepID=A0A367KTW9_RHIST|nr:hypothetical protein CU098_007171 [Rhizopus stolonifer]
MAPERNKAYRTYVDKLVNTNKEKQENKDVTVAINIGYLSRSTKRQFKTGKVGRRTKGCRRRRELYEKDIKVVRLYSWSQSDHSPKEKSKHKRKVIRKTVNGSSMCINPNCAAVINKKATQSRDAVSARTIALSGLTTLLF